MPATWIRQNTQAIRQLFLTWVWTAKLKEQLNGKLVGGFNPSENISQNGNLPQIGLKINIFETVVGSSEGSFVSFFRNNAPYLMD